MPGMPVIDSGAKASESAATRLLDKARTTDGDSGLNAACGLTQAPETKHKLTWAAATVTNV